jgi:hypothetical protein
MTTPEVVTTRETEDREAADVLPPIALKEWAVVCDALLAGEQVVMVRKGGIHETRTGFRPEHEVFYLYPNTEHQAPERVQARLHARLSRHGPPPQESGTVSLPGYCEVVDVVQVTDGARLRALEPLTCWTQAFFDVRLAYRPELPIYVLTARAYRFLDGLSVPYLKAYGGCRSWVPLRTTPVPGRVVPALDAAAFEAQRRLVLATLG